MIVIKTIEEMKAYVRDIKKKNRTICLVPTMGYLHKGHTDLMCKGRTLADNLVISIYVNPTQFGPNEDLAKYPRDFEMDHRLSEEVGVDCIFYPDNAQMYPQGYATYVNVEGITETLCGRTRPTHFRGVTTIVAKLFNIVEPDSAVFGLKDYQQLTVIKRMVIDLNMNVQIIPHPTVREEDGLAMSSRNKYLTPEQRKHALVLSRSLNHARDMAKAGNRNATAIRAAVVGMISSTPDCVLDYAEIVHPETLACLERIEDHAVMALAVKVGATRLIDNMELL
jgi:pantoate--beta-alanine ligase